MARIRWGSNVTAAFDTAGAWVGGVAPAAGDTAVFDGEYNGNCTNVAAPLDLTTGDIERAQAYIGQIGTSGAPLEVSSTRLTYYGPTGSAWFLGLYDEIAIRAGQANPISIQKSAADVASILYATQGRITLASDGTGSHAYLQIHVGYHTDPANDVVMTIEADTGECHELNVYAGRVTTSRSFDEINVDGGVLTVSGEAKVDTIIRQGGGVVYWDGEGDIDDMQLFGGNFDASRSGKPISIGAQSTIAAPARVNLNRGAGNITYLGTVHILGKPALEVWQADAGSFVYV